MQELLRFQLFVVPGSVSVQAHIATFHNLRTLAISRGGDSMPTKRTKVKEDIHDHANGSIWAKGQTIDGVMIAYKEWFGKDGTKMRSGFFENGEQVGEW